jgi:DNA-binding NarL/FixJ family response regulator
VAICDTQPVTAEGIRNLLSGAGDLQFLLPASSLSQALDAARLHRPSVLMIDKGFGIQAILEWLGEAFQLLPQTGIVIWGVAVTEAEALRFLQCGARGILRKTAAVPVVLACLRNLAEGRTWMEDSVFRNNPHPERYSRTHLTAPEQQVLELVEQGLKNKEIADELGIRPGTVKIHLKHIFEKSGKSRLLWVGFERAERAGIGVGSGSGGGGPAASRSPTAGKVEVWASKPFPLASCLFRLR